jgi:hypothetical protein
MPGYKPSSISFWQCYNTGKFHRGFRDQSKMDRCSYMQRLPACARLQQAYFFGGLIMMWAPAVPGDISQGAPSLALVERPVDSGVAKGR